MKKARLWGEFIKNLNKNKEEITCLPRRKNSLVKVVIVLKKGEIYTKGEVGEKTENRKQNKDKPLIIFLHSNYGEN